MEVQTGDFLLGFSQPTPKLLGSPSAQGHCLDQTPGKQRTVVWQSTAASASYSSKMSQEGQFYQLSQCFVCCGEAWCSQSLHLFSPVPLFRTPYQRPPEPFPHAVLALLTISNFLWRTIFNPLVSSASGPTNQFP